MDSNKNKIDGILFGILIKKLRIERDISSKELAILTFDDEAKHSRISEYENGKIANPTNKTVERICLALNIDIDELPNILSNIKDEINQDSISSALRFVSPNLRPLFAARAKKFGYDVEDYAQEVLSKVALKGTIASIKPMKN